MRPTVSTATLVLIHWTSELRSRSQVEQLGRSDEIAGPVAHARHYVPGLLVLGPTCVKNAFEVTEAVRTTEDDRFAVEDLY